MNLFLLAYSTGTPCDVTELRSALSGVSEELAFFPGEQVESWASPSGRFACAWIAHGPDRIGGVRYVHRSDARLALFSGRPFLWLDDGADGRTPIDPVFYLDASDASLLALDGRFVAARYDDRRRTLDVVTDPLGAYPIFETTRSDLRLISNNAEVLRRLRGLRQLSLGPVASLFCGGWPLSGNPIWEGIKRLEGAGIHEFGPARVSLRESFDGAPRSLFGSSFEPRRAAKLLAESVRALADWPGRPSIVGLTAGRDSRVVFGATTAAALDVLALTGGAPQDPDVLIGGRLAEKVGIAHVIDLEHVDPRVTDWRRAARLIDLMASGTVSLSDAHGYKLTAPAGPLALWHSGQGGEIARGYYGTGTGLDTEHLTDLLFRRFGRRRVGLTPILSEPGERLVREQIGRWVERQEGAGFAPEDIPDLFYLTKRMGTWAGPGHGCVEYVRDTTSPLWSHRLLPDELGLPAETRRREVFHLAVLQELEPRLVDVPFEPGNGWPARRGAVRARIQPLVEVLREAPDEARRRLHAIAPRNANGRRQPRNTALGRALPAVRELVLSQPEHAAWDVLDRPRVRHLLAAHPDSLDFVSTMYVWHLATIFAAGSGPVM